MEEKDHIIYVGQTPGVDNVVIITKRIYKEMYL